jgi:hypothetical protein
VVDDRRLEEAGELAGAGNGERRVAQLLRLQRARTRTLGELGNLGRDLVDRLRVRTANDRDDEPVVGLDRDTDVVAIEIDDGVTVQPCVQLGELAERVGACLDDGRQKAIQRNVLEVALLDPRDGRHLTMRTRHVLGDEAAHAAKRLAPAFLGLGCDRTHVVLGDPSGGTAPHHGREVDAELSGDAAHDRSRLHPARRLRLHWCGYCATSVLGRSWHRLSRLTDDHELGSDGRELALGYEDPEDGPRVRRGNFDRGLVGLDLDERVVLRDLLPLRDEPASDLAFSQPLPEVRKLERLRHYP